MLTKKTSAGDAGTWTVFDNMRGINADGKAARLYPNTSDSENDYTASGVYNQYIYIAPESEIVIAKTSSNYKYTSELQMSKDMHIAMFRSIAQHINPKN